MAAQAHDVCGVIKLRSNPQVKAPEWRALEQIVAEARAAGRQVVTLGPAGIFEIVSHHRDTEDTENVDKGSISSNLLNLR